MPTTHIYATFKSNHRDNECYVFVKDRYAVVNYEPGAKKDKILKGPLKIVSGFSVLAGTPFATRINCAFETHHREAFIFSGNHCAKITYAAPPIKILLGPITIAHMFTCLRGTSFENGIDAAIKIHGKHVLLFKGDMYAKIDYHSNHCHSKHHIRNGFKTLVGTIFESGIDAAFKSHHKEQAYIFKNEYYACIDIVDGDITGGRLLGRILRIKDRWPNLTGLLNCGN